MAPDSRESGAFYFGANGLGAWGKGQGAWGKGQGTETGNRRTETGEGKTGNGGNSRPENQIFLFISNYFNLFKNKLLCID